MIEPLIFIAFILGIAAVGLNYEKIRKARLTIIMLASVSLFVFSVAFPPWRITVTDDRGHALKTSVVWSFLGSSPQHPGAFRQSARIAFDVFALQTSALLASAITVLWLIRKTE